MGNFKKALEILTLLGAGFLAACTGTQKLDPLAGGGGLSGTWRSSDNIFTAHFENGAFRSIANDTGNTLSEGSYVVVSNQEIRLNWFGVISQANNSATCKRPNPVTLNCTDARGRSFTLVKTTQTPIQAPAQS